MLRGGISAGPASAWAGGIGTGTLFTLSNLDDRHLSTAFDSVRAFGLTDSPNPPGGGGGGAHFSLPGNDAAAISSSLYRAANGGREALPATGFTPMAFADFGWGNGTTYFSQVTAVNPAGESGPATEVSAPPRAMVSALDAPANLSATAGQANVASVFRVGGQRVVPFARYDSRAEALKVAGLSDQDERSLA
jgi:hypothetical protein